MLASVAVTGGIAIASPGIFAGHPASRLARESFELQPGQAGPRIAGIGYRSAAGEASTTLAMASLRETRAVEFLRAAARRAAARQAAARRAARLRAAARAAARQAAAAQQAAAAPAVGSGGGGSPVPSGSPQQIAMSMLGSFGWSSSEFGCLQSLWDLESGWNPTASNPSTGAYGIPQALPGSKMASAGPDWQTNPATQIRWGLGYIRADYGSPCGAWSHEQATGWY